MADTELNIDPNGICDDCGTKGTRCVHWGSLVPPSTKLKLCGACFKSREEYFKEYHQPKPLQAGKVD